MGAEKIKCYMTVNLLIFGAAIIGYLAFALVGGVYISNIEDESRKKNTLNAFIAFNVVLLCGAVAYAYITLA